MNRVFLTTQFKSMPLAEREYNTGQLAFQVCIYSGLTTSVLLGTCGQLLVRIIEPYIIRIVGINVNTSS